MSTGDMGNEHPHLDINLIKEQLSVEEIQIKLKEISERVTFANNTGNYALINQLTMVRETYARAQREKLEEMFGDNGSNKNYDGKIDIS